MLRARIGSLERLHYEITTMVGWPALAESLLEDVEMLRAALGSGHEIRA